jgi:hypothetical protein
MKVWLCAGAMLLVAGLVWTGTVSRAAQGEEKVDLKFKAFDAKAAPFYQRLETTTEQKMSVGNPPQEMTQKQTQVFIIKWTPKEMKDSQWVVEQTIEGVEMNINIGTTKIEYSSDKTEAAKNPMTEFFESLMKVKLTLYIDPAKFEVKKVEGRQEFVDKLGEAHPQMKKLLNNILSEDAIIKMSQQTWAAVPYPSELPLTKDKKSWTRESTLNLGAIGKYKNTYKYELDSAKTTAKMATITVTPKMDYTAPESGEKELPFQLKKETKLNSVEGKETGGTVEFDIANGRIDKSDMSMKVTGEIVVDIGGMETKVKLEQTQKSKLTTSEKKPNLKQQ